jgi:hypothetical protein
MTILYMKMRFLSKYLFVKSEPWSSIKTAFNPLFPYKKTSNDRIRRRSNNDEDFKRYDFYYNCIIYTIN